MSMINTAECTDSEVEMSMDEADANGWHWEFVEVNGVEYLQVDDGEDNIPN